ncbi:MAG TPA: hypothetical protein VG406_28390 [Isosphaeraceae bacterium]|jgi:hypothetical protein|nr:hypothetical protein [Isosphaeraceae bacterium]
MKGTLRTSARLGAVALIALMAGCVKEEVRGDTSVFAFNWWMAGLAFAGGLLAVPIGLVIRHKAQWPGWVLAFILGPCLIFGIAPAMVLDRATVDQDHFEVRYGFWFAPHRVNVKFEDLRRMRLSTQAKGLGRRRRIQRSMDLTFKSGQTQRVSVGDLLQRAAPRIVERAEAKGVIVMGSLNAR